MAKLKPRARIIRTIGDHLISGPEAALIELVKNAYDADATWIQIKIAPECTDFPEGLVRVSDNGHGMTRLDIEDKWFEPATNDKLKSRFSRTKKRRMLGAKGIGRFASARLGYSTSVESRAETGAGLERTRLTINWQDFEASKYLDELDIPLETEILENSKLGAGVTITIGKSRVVWTHKIAEKLIMELRRLVSPRDVQGEFKIYLDLSSFKETEKKDSATNFDGKALLRKLQVEVVSNDEQESNDSDLITPYQVQQDADYLLVGSFTADGEFSGEFLIERGDNVPQQLSVPAPPLNWEEESCGAFSIKIKVYDREPEAVEALFGRMGLDFSKIGVRRARQILSESAGIGVYRDGFRIRPYGEADNDWLLLERRRILEPSKRVGHTQTAGEVIIGGEEQSNLVERSSREGFEHNRAFERLRKLITNVLVRAEERRFDYRQQAGLSRKTSGDVGQVKQMAALDGLINEANKLPAASRKVMLERIQKESAALTKSLEEIEAYQKLLESQSALGLVVARVIHDGRRYLEPMSFAATSLLEGRAKLFDQGPLGEVIRKYYPVHAETISTGVKGLSSLFKALDPVSGKKRGKPVNFSALEVIRVASSFMEDFMIEASVDLSIHVDEKLTLFGYGGDLQFATLNILDNAIHWLKTISIEQRKISISAESSDGFAYITIANNGPEIDHHSATKLFNPGFTLKTEGHGLGLVIAREACRASKGDIYFDDAKDDTTFVIKFPMGL